MVQNTNTEVFGPPEPEVFGPPIPAIKTELDIQAGIWGAQYQQHQTSLENLSEQHSSVLKQLESVDDKSIWEKLESVAGIINPAYGYIASRQTRSEADKLAEQSNILLEQINVEKFYIDLYNKVPQLLYNIGNMQLIASMDTTKEMPEINIDEMIQELGPPGTMTTNELNSVKDVISGMVNAIIPGQPTTDLTIAESPELVPPSYKISQPTTIHTLTVDAIVKYLTAPEVPDPILTMDEYEDFLVEAGYISDKADLESYEYYKEQANAIVADWQEWTNLRNTYKIELPKQSFSDKIKEALLSPGLTLLEISSEYFEYVSQPLAGFVFGVLPRGIFMGPFAGKDYMKPVVDIRAQYYEYSRTGNHWKAFGQAWVSWDPELPILDDTAAEWIMKYILMEGAVDPLSYAGFGIYTKIARPYGRVGRAVGAFERGYMQVCEVPFNIIKAPIYYKWTPEALQKLKLPSKWAGQYAIPRTTQQQGIIAMNKTGQFMDNFLTKKYGKALYQLDMKQWDVGASQAIKWSFAHPEDVSSDIGRAGQQLLKHAPITKTEVQDWANRLHTTLLPNDITITTVDNVDQLFETFFAKVDAPNKLLPNPEAARELVSILHGAGDGADIIASKILQDKAKTIISSAHSFGAAKNPVKALGKLMQRNYKHTVDTIRSDIVLERVNMGRYSSLLYKVPDSVQKIWMKYLDGAVRTFAESYLCFAAYGPMNVLEDILRTTLGGVDITPVLKDVYRIGAPKFITGIESKTVVIDLLHKFQSKWAGTIYDQNFSHIAAIMETFGTIRARKPGELNNFIMQMGGLAKGMGDRVMEYTLDRPGQINQMIRLHFVDAYATQQLKRNGGELLDRLVKTMPTLTGITDKKMYKQVQQEATELVMQGQSDALRAAKANWTRAKVHHREVNNLIMKYPNLDRVVRDHILLQSSDGELYLQGLESVDREILQSADTIVDNFIHSAEFAHEGFENLTSKLIELEVRNPQEMATLIKSLNLMSAMYSATPSQIMGRAVERTRGLPYAQRHAALDEVMDNITTFRVKAGVSMDKLMDKIKLSMNKPDSMIDWNKVTWGKGFEDPKLQSKVKSIIDKLPLNIKPYIKEFRIEPSVKGAIATYGNGLFQFRSTKDVIAHNLVHEVGHSVQTYELHRAWRAAWGNIVGIDIRESFAEAFMLWQLYPDSFGTKTFVTGFLNDVKESFAEAAPRLAKFFDEYFPKTQRNLGYNPEYISLANQLFDLQTAQRQRGAELAEQVNAFRHEWFTEGKPKEIADESWWDQYSFEVSSRWHNYRVEMAGFEGQIAKHIETMDTTVGVKFQRPPIQIIDRPLAPYDIARLIGTRGDDITRALLDPMVAQSDREMFVEYVLAKVRNGDIGFTRDSIGAVYDQIMASLHIARGKADWITNQEMALSSLKRDLHDLWNSKLLPDNEVKAISGFFDNTADNLDREMYEEVVTQGEVTQLVPSRPNIPGMVKIAPDKMAREFWDANLEYNKLRVESMVRSDAAGLLAVRLENAGDMLREMGKDFSDLGYFMEKLSRIKNSLNDSGWFRPLTNDETAKILAIKSQVNSIPAATNMTEEIKSMMFSLLDRDTESVGIKLDQIEKLAKSEPLVVTVKIPPNVGRLPTKTIRPEYANYQQLRQDAMDEAHRWYYKEFTDYTHANVFDAIMKSIYPFWSYETQRWFWVPRSFVRHPGTFTQYNRWQDNSDYGYVHIPNTSIDVNPFRGTVYGTLTTRLTRRDFPEYYDSLGAAGEALRFNDFLTHYGFYPSTIFTLPVSVLFGQEMQTGEAIPPFFKTGLDFLVAALPNNESVEWISGHVFGDRFRNYITMLAVNKMGGDGSLIFSKMSEGEPLTPEEEQIWSDARRESSLYSAGFEQFGLFRMRTDEQYRIAQEATKLIEELFHISPEMQKEAERRGINLWDLVGGLSPSEQAIFEQLGYYKYAGISRPLLPGKQQTILNQIEIGWDKVDKYTDNIQTQKLKLEQEFLSGIRSPSSYIESLQNLYSDQHEYIITQMESLLTEPLPSDLIGTDRENWIESHSLMSLEGRKEYFKKYAEAQPVQSPIEELAALYFSIKLKETTNPETGEIIMDWDNFFAQRKAVEESIPDDYKKEWDSLISKNSTPLELVRREVYNKYFSTYNKLWSKILSTYDINEQGLITEYLYLENTQQQESKQEEIANIISTKTGNKLISSFRSEVSSAKKALRYSNPYLDAWLYLWGETTTFTTSKAQLIYFQLAKQIGKKAV